MTKLVKVLAVSLLLLLGSTNARAQATSNYGVLNYTFLARANATGNGTAFAIPQASIAYVTYCTSFGSAPASITLNIQISLDNTTYSTFDTSTSTAGECRSFFTAAKFLRGNISAVSGGTTTTTSFNIQRVSTSNSNLSTNIAALATQLFVTNSGIAATSTDGVSLANNTASTAGITAQYSPRLRFTGSAWNSSSVASETDSWVIENRPITNAGATTHALTFLSSIAGASYTTLGSIDNLGTMNMQQFSAANSSYFQWNGRSRIYSSSDGLIEVKNNAGTGFTRFNFGGSTSSFPSLAVSSTALIQQLADGTNGGTLGASGAFITSGAGTGITVNDTGSLRTQYYKVTVTSAQFIAAAVTADVTIATLPAKTQLLKVYADLTQTFACASTCTTATLSFTCGSAAGGNTILVTFDADAATTQRGLADADLGTDLTRATAVQGGKMYSWSATQIISCRLTSGTGNIGTGAATNLSQGSITFYLETEKLP
jgi:hypothetical protein